MDFGWLKQSMPKGLYGRAALILLLPIVVSQVVVAVVFVQRHFAQVTEQMVDTMLREVRFYLVQVETAPDAETALVQTAALARALNFQVDLPGDPGPGFKRRFYDVSGRTVIREMRNKVPQLTSIDLTVSTRQVRMGLDTVHGPMLMVFDRRRVSASNPHQLLVIMGFIAVVMTLVAFVYMRNQLRPITRLARAAEAFGRGRVEPYRPTGAVEVRAAGSAFLDMRARIERQTQARTMMLSGVSHDLRTPLTRLRLGLSMSEPGPERAAMEQDLDEMEAMLDAFLDFARGDAGDAPEPADPLGLAERVVENARRGGGQVALDVPDIAQLTEADVTVPLRVLAVERALANLLSNALRYGNEARVVVTLGERMVRFTVEDDGPGIPEESREEALRPFARLDAARNQDSGASVGLGLSIANDVARVHGGTLRLGESAALGGLKAELVLAR